MTLYLLKYFKMIHLKKTFFIIYIIICFLLQILPFIINIFSDTNFDFFIGFPLNIYAVRHTFFSDCGLVEQSSSLINLFLNLALYFLFAIIINKYFLKNNYIEK